MYLLFFAAFVLMMLTVFSGTESGGSEGVEVLPDTATNGLVRQTTRREYAVTVLLALGAGAVALVGLYLQNG